MKSLQFSIHPPSVAVVPQLRRTGNLQFCLLRRSSFGYEGRALDDQFTIFNATTVRKCQMINAKSMPNDKCEIPNACEGAKR